MAIGSRVRRNGCQTASACEGNAFISNSTMDTVAATQWLMGFARLLFAFAGQIDFGNPVYETGGVVGFEEAVPRYPLALSLLRISP
ncbi:hypothetical protein Poly24_48540 [Rosistilla carotiformis]|uniref:Uncharacterized protein n=2 Tax=Rosistilla carotiformis TaxID=2528017 RepID=A0A518JZZ5_9BACT|nr:hypothetical protein Poly24_48540 [Rosistilla carotiformis]